MGITLAVIGVTLLLTRQFFTAVAIASPVLVATI